METNQVNISLNVNGKKIQITTYEMKRLLDVLREDIGLTGTKEGCGEGECGACSIFMDGQLVNSCLIPVFQAEGKKIETIENLEGKTELHKIQKSFLQHGGAQCGICTPGMILATKELLAKKSGKLTAKEIEEGLGGNLCRCTGYLKIFESVKQAEGK